MEKKENAATAHPLGVCEKLYNAIVNKPSLNPLRRPRLTSGANSHVAEGQHSESASSLPPAAKDNQQKTGAAAATTLPKEVPSLQKQNLATKPPETGAPQLPKDEPNNTNILPSVTKLPTRHATIPEKQNASQLMAPTTAEKTRQAPTSVLKLVTDKGKVAPAVPAPSPPPPPAAVQGKAAPPPAAPPTTPVVQVKAPSQVPAAQPAAPSVRVKAPPPSAPPTAPQVPAKAPPPAMPPTTAAPAARPAVAAEEATVAEIPASVVEKGTSAAPMRSAANTSDKSESFIRRARKSWLSSGTLAGTRKQI